MLQAYYANIPAKDIASRMRTTLTVVYRRARLSRLHKSEFFRNSPWASLLRQDQRVGVPYRYPKGHVPANKGLRRPGYAVGRMRETQFKKGDSPRNALPLWSFRWVDGYMMLKTGKAHKQPNTRWEYVHKLVWEQAHGPIPAGYRIWWKDGDHANNFLANLELLNGADHARRTSIHNLPVPLKRVIMTKGLLRRRINRMEKKEHGEKHDG